jgi:hypothetical protein
MDIAAIQGLQNFVGLLGKGRHFERTAKGSIGLSTLNDLDIHQTPADFSRLFVLMKGNLTVGASDSEYLW